MVIAVEPEDERILREILDPEFDDVHYDSSADHAMTAFVSLAPKILVMAFPDISGAERFYLSLFRMGDNAAAKIAHQAIILCHINETKTAYSLCKKRVFDDYIAFHPLHDPNRLKLSIDLALERIELREAAKGGVATLSDTTADLERLGGYLDSAIGEGKVIGNNLNTTSSRLAKLIEQQVESLRQVIVKLQSEGGIERGDSARVNTQLENLEKSTRQAGKSVSVTN